MDVSGSGLCPLVGFDGNDVEPQVSLDVCISVTRFA